MHLLHLNTWFFIIKTYLSISKTVISL